MGEELRKEGSVGLFSLLVLSTLTISAAPVNLAIHRPAAQSSTYGNDARFAASNGVDGNKYDSSLFHTTEEDGPWWEVDLGADYAIDNVILYNRVGCCQERVHGLQVLLSSDGVNYLLIYTHDNYAFRDR